MSLKSDHGQDGIPDNIHFRAVFDASPDAVLIVDREGFIVEVNETTGRMFGYDPGELTGQKVEVLVPKGRRQAHAGVRSEFQRAPQTRPMGIGLELSGVRKDGSEVPVEVSLSPLRQGENALIVASVRDISERTQARAFRAAAIRASENERARIARDLHDDTAQRLAAAIINLRLLNRAAAGDREEQASALRQELTEIAEGVRRIARGLRPPELDEVGLGSAVQNWSRTLHEPGRLAVEVHADPVDEQLTSDQRLVLYRVIQEALTNAKRHSGATDATVRIREEQGTVIASVRDNGTGFDPEMALTQVRGLGLHGMNERAAMIGARLRIESALAQGTEVFLEIDTIKPLEARP